MMTDATRTAPPCSLMRRWRLADHWWWRGRRRHRRRVDPHHEDLVEGGVNDAHPSFAQLPLDAVLAVQDGPDGDRGQAAVHPPTIQRPNDTATPRPVRASRCARHGSTKASMSISAYLRSRPESQHTARN